MINYEGHQQTLNKYTIWPTALSINKKRRFMQAKGLILNMQNK